MTSLQKVTSLQTNSQEENYLMMKTSGATFSKPDKNGKLKIMNGKGEVEEVSVREAVKRWNETISILRSRNLIDF